MKHITFYTRCRDCTTGDLIKEVQGYTDGHFFYWRQRSTWHAVEPSTGLSTCTGRTLKVTIENASSPGNINRVAAFLNRFGEESTKRFTDLLKNVGITEYNWQEIASNKKN
ncbi:MAG: hypothetical protein J6V52_05405 [Bacteroidaceae bacterium]|nr:hypothetical protein [Bacteroidaceae bacterium]